MVTWKERGEVPDSDEEEDWGSQDLPNDGRQKATLAEFPKARKDQSQSQQGQIESCGRPAHEQLSLLDIQTSHGLPASDALLRVASGSPSTSRAFKIPPTLLGSQELPPLNQTIPEDHPGIDEEFSRTYIALSSPLSELCVSPIGSATSIERYATENVGLGTSIIGEDPFAAAPTEDLQVSLDTYFVENESHFPSTSRRSLRQRNPIQLHPYALEGEKYRRTLMDRGMRPLRLAQARERHSRTNSRLSSSPDPDFESGESQIHTAEVGSHSSRSLSQHLNPDMVVGPSFNSVSRPAAAGGDDEEFPEVNELLILQPHTFPGVHSRNRKTIYGSQNTSRVSSKLSRPHLLQSRNRMSGRVEALDNPPSPQTTSSPLPIFDTPHKNCIRNYKSTNLDSSRATSVEDVLSQDDRGASHFPTPATNSVKHVVDLTAGDMDEEDPFASDTQSEVSSSPHEAEQSVQVQRVAKKIRGVLPASWLRLDQQIQRAEELKITRQQPHSLSPVKASARRGTAVPKEAPNAGGHIARVDRNETYFTLDDTDDEEEDSSVPSFVKEFMPEQESDIAFSQMEVDSMMEDDGIDTMLAPQKRKSKLLPSARQRKRRAVSTSLFHRKTYDGYQPKITDHLITPRNASNNAHKTKRQRIRISGSNVLKMSSNASRTHKDFQSNIPNLSILDIVSPALSTRESVPQFIRIAARNARSKRGLGRHSPTKKFIRLATREDTEDAQSALRDWREGTIRPRIGNTVRPTCGNMQPLAEVSGNPQVMFSPSSRNTAGLDFEVPIFPSGSVEPAFTTLKQPHTSSVTGHRFIVKPRGNTHARKYRRAPQVLTSVTRQAQLETSLADYSHRHPSAAFGSTKKTLDALYKKSYKGSAVRGDVQLARFLAQNPVVQVGDVALLVNPTEKRKNLSITKGRVTEQVRHRKQVPVHLDANAAIFRQPSVPLILEPFQAKPETQSRFSSDGKLAGLGTYGTTYTYHFDIFPLQLGVFFHESTFIGSGRLRKALDISSTFPTNHGYTLHQLAGKHLRWGSWNATVSSELGLCIDWIVDQLDGTEESLSGIGGNNILECLSFIIDYVQASLGFLDQSGRKDCLAKFTEVLHTLVERLTIPSSNQVMESALNLQLSIDLSVHAMILVYQLLQICYIGPPESESACRLEMLLQETGTRTISLLLSQGLDAVRTLYEDLQYLTFREAGIKSDRYAAQAWVVAMHVLKAARLHPVSFWDVFNSAVMVNSEAKLNDARVMERIWYSMFSLLPLAGFDMTGVVTHGMRASKSMENWALPQRLLKILFDLYETKSRQSPSFNDYFRILFNRCSHLMQAWCWGRHNLIVGTLFDFFARHNLAHLRHEEVYQSPRFLEELDLNPSLTVDRDDRCFHILLKIIAITIKQMYELGDSKSIRNIVTRVLPNHDRQYPKEETVHQRDLASLRNHHDLLCTLFWAAPPDLRPSTNLIRELINPANSHKEAYLINLRAWQNIMRFVLASNPTAEEFLALDTWQSDCFSQLMGQYESVEKDVEDQLQHLNRSAQQLVSQHTIADTIDQNRNQILAVMLQHLRAIEWAIATAPDMNAARIVFYGKTTGCIVEILNRFGQRNPAHIPIIISVLDVIQAYTSKLNSEIPPTSWSNHDDGQEDSQEYGSDLFTDWEPTRPLYTGELGFKILEVVRKILRTTLCAVAPINLDFTQKILDTWALIAGTLMMSKTYTLSDFISDTGRFNELRMDDKARGVRCFAGYFLSRVALVTEGHMNLQDTDRDLLSDWLCLLVQPAACLSGEHVLLPLYAQLEPILVCMRTVELDSFRGDLFNCSINIIVSYRQTIIASIFQAMSEQLQRHSDNKARYQAVLRRLMDTMKRDSIDIDPKTYEAGEHHHFISGVLLHITTFFHDLCPIDEFFRLNSIYSLNNEPQLFVATLRNYALRLNTDRGKSEFSHFCFAFAKNVAIEGELAGMANMLLESMESTSQQWKDLAHHVLIVLTPAFVHTAFVSDSGWLLAEPFLVASGHQLQALATYDTVSALRGASTILSTIVNGIWFLAFAQPTAYGNPVRYPLLYTTFLATRFVNSTLNWLPWTAGECPDLEEKVVGYLNLFNSFAIFAREYLESLTGASIRAFSSFRQLPDVAKELERHQHHGACERGSSLYKGLREARDTDEGKRWLQEAPNTVGPDFSTVILADMQQNWSQTADWDDIQIRFGPNYRFAKGLSSKAPRGIDIYDSLLRELDFFAHDYPRISLPVAEGRKRARRLALAGLDSEDLMF